MARGDRRHTGSDRYSAWHHLGHLLSRPLYFWIVAASLIASYLLQYNINYSRYGRAMRATAQSEHAANAVGINPATTRTLSFVISAMLAGLAGGLYAFLNLFVNYETFTFLHSVSFLLMVILGGTGTLLGPILGTSSIVYLTEILQDLQEWQVFAYGFLLAIAMFVMPLGFVGTWNAMWHRLRSPSTRGQALPWPDRGVALSPFANFGAEPNETALETGALPCGLGALRLWTRSISRLVRAQFTP